MFAKSVKGLFVALGAGLPLGILVLAGMTLWSAASEVVKDRYQAVAADILVPMFTTVSAALFTAGIIKGILVHLENTQLEALKDQPREIRFFDW